MSQMYLFTGENTFALREELSRWISEFRAKHGPENLSRLDGNTLTRTQLLDEIAAAPFIAEKRMIIIDELPRLEKEDVEAIQKVIHPDVLLVINAPTLDKRLSATKEFMKLATLKDFTLLSPQALSHWIDALLKKESTSLSADARKLLFDLVGTDQEILFSELSKLALYVGGRTISKEDVEKLVVSSGERAVWHLLDLLGSGKTHEALLYCEVLLQGGENAHALWSRLLWMVESLGACWSMVAEGEKRPAVIAKEMGLPFPTVRGLIPLCQKMEFATVKKIIDEMSRSDMDLKTGVFKATVEGSQELEALIDRSLLRFT